MGLAGLRGPPAALPVPSITYQCLARHHPPDGGLSAGNDIKLTKVLWIDCAGMSHWVSEGLPLPAGCR